MINIDDTKQWEAFDTKNTYHESIHMPQNILISWEQYATENLSDEVYNGIFFVGKGFYFAQKMIAALYPHMVKNIPDDRTLMINIDETNVKKNNNTINIVRKGYLNNAHGVEVSIQDFDFFNTPQQSVVLLKILHHYHFITNTDKIVHLAAANLIQKAGALCQAKNQPYNLAKNYAVALFNSPTAIISFHQEYHLILEYVELLSKRWNIENIEIIQSKNMNFLAEKEISNFLILQNFYKEKDADVYHDFQKYFSQNQTCYDVYSDGKNTFAEMLSLIYFMNVMMFYIAMMQKKTI